jgi:hypothetical protein
LVVKGKAEFINKKQGYDLELALLKKKISKLFLTFPCFISKGTLKVNKGHFVCVSSQELPVAGTVPSYD